MRHTLQTVIPVRLQFGRRETGRYKSTQPDRLAETTAVTSHYRTRLTTHALAELRSQDVEKRRLGASILRLASTRKGRKILRAMQHRASQGLPVTWPDVDAR